MSFSDFSQSQNQQEHLVVTRATLNTETPISGVEIVPYIVTRKTDGTSTTDDISRENPADNGQYLRYKWFRSGRKSKTAVCSVHPAEAATLQNVHNRQFHCDGECFKRGWREWMRNRIANGLEDTDQERRQPTRATKYNVSANEQQKENTNNMGGRGEYQGSRDDLFMNKEEEEKASQSAVPPWVEVSTDRTYLVKPTDVGHVLKLEIQPCDSKAAAPNERGVAETVVTSRVIPAPSPPKRNLVPIQKNDAAEPGTFTVMSYNVLADVYCTTEMYGYAPPWALSWYFRRQNILKELVQMDADVLCLQEVQSDHFEDFFQGELAKYGYSSVYKKKTAQIFSEGKYVIDGCAIFFKKDKFALIKKYEVEFNKAALSLAESLVGSGGSKTEALNRLMKDNIALIVVLEALDSQQRQQQQQTGKRKLLCVANTHIHANTDHNDVKLWQVHTLLKGLEKIAASAEIPMVACGDFNSTPGSAAHGLLTRGMVDNNHPELQIDPLGILRPASKLSHPLPLVSAYSSALRRDSRLIESEALERLRDRVDPRTAEPNFTNCTKDFFGALDYLFYTEDTLSPVALLELPGEKDARAKYGGLPNTQWSSDHISLMTEFQWGPANFQNPY